MSNTGTNTRSAAGRTLGMYSRVPGSLRSRERNLTLREIHCEVVRSSLLRGRPSKWKRWVQSALLSDSMLVSTLFGGAVMDVIISWNGLAPWVVVFSGPAGATFVWTPFARQLARRVKNTRLQYLAAPPAVRLAEVELEISLSRDTSWLLSSSY